MEGYDPAIHVRASGRELNISPKAAREICLTLKGLTLSKAIALMEKVETMKAPIAFRRHKLKVGHRSELVGFPTETVYGLGGDATNGRAVAAGLLQDSSMPSMEISHGWNEPDVPAARKRFLARGPEPLRRIRPQRPASATRFWPPSSPLARVEIRPPSSPMARVVAMAPSSFRALVVA